ncbi:hypothetical protein NP493_589g02013 [Ridgeia piscesae]|uniref:Cytochrome c oxidase subunit 4 n=1 Tax=Ridgeia piscesae TaxID=27915 RepID=A0AAD9NP53_RIDPI|nr:hypothetical protein NP493_589g02013 [Ridgeia piscesae]
MLRSLTRTALRQGARISHRAIATTAVRPADASDLTIQEREQIYPKLGNRDIVGYGFNGNPVYIDREEWPAPAVRFRENTAEVQALRAKEQGDWKALTLEEKKGLYRASFRQTYAEMTAPTGEWKTVIAGLLLGLSFTGWVLIWMKTCVYPPMPRTITKEWQVAQAERMVKQRQGAVLGISSQWDYEKNEWK